MDPFAIDSEIPLKTVLIALPFFAPCAHTCLIYSKWTLFFSSDQTLPIFFILLSRYCVVLDDCQKKHFQVLSHNVYSFLVSITNAQA